MIAQGGEKIRIVLQAGRKAPGFVRIRGARKPNLKNVRARNGRFRRPSLPAGDVLA